MRLFFVLYFVLCVYDGFAQEIPLGTWRTHACYQAGRQVVVGKDGIYCATANGLFLYQNTENTFQILSKQQGLTQALPTQIGYDAVRNTLIIAYPDRTIDLLKDYKITEIAILRQSPFPNNPQINQILPTPALAYIATDFGVVLLDVAKQEVRDTYRNLGINGAELPIFGLSFSQDSLLLATAQGVLIGKATDNLADFQQWKRFNATNGLPPQKIKKIITRDTRVYALTENNQLLRYNHQHHWTIVPLPTENYSDMALSGTDILLTAEAGKLYTLDNTENITTQTHATLQSPRAVVRDETGTTWIADSKNGLLELKTGIWKSHFPNSPASPDTWQARFIQNKVIITSGGFNESLQPLQRASGYYTFQDGSWASNALPALLDLTSYAYIPQNQTQYFGSYGKGLWHQKQDASIDQFTQTNSPLQASALGDVRITDLATDASGTVWIANHAVGTGQASLHARTLQGTWQSYLPPFTAGRNPVEILIAQNGWKWIRLSAELGGGIWVLDDKNNRNRWLNTTPNQGGLPSNQIHAIVQDKEGLIWVGTAKGIAVFYTPQEAFGNINALLPIYGGRPLLRDEIVQCMAIDGGNRKWVGTTTGLWLFDDEGANLLAYFQEKNSPLPSENIKAMTIHPNTGEVFLITAGGLVSYRGTATEANNTYSETKVFPNPVLPNYEGLVGISGLPTGAKVKITDISGRLFYETTAQGGTASWNLQDYQGARAKAGIYLIYTLKADGSAGKVLKIAVLE